MNFAAISLGSPAAGKVVMPVDASRQRLLSSLPIDVLAGPLLLGGARLASLAMVACVSRRMREAAAVAAARHNAVSLLGAFDAADGISLLSRLPSLTALDISGASDVVASCLLGNGASGYLSSVQCLRTSGVSDARALERVVASSGPRLRAVGLRACAVTEQLTSTMAAACPHLEAVDLSNSRVDDDGIGLLALQCGPGLKQVALRGCFITDAALSSLALGAPQLQTLDVGWCREISDRGMQKFAAHTCLTALDLSKCAQLSFKTVRQLAGLPDLKKLTAAGMLGTDGTEEVETFRLLSLSTSLTSLDVSIPNPPWVVGDRAIAALCGDAHAEPRCPPLSHLRLVNCYVTAGGCHRLADAFAGTLLSLDLTGAPVNDSGLESIARGCSLLEVLRVNSCSHITDRGCQCICGTSTVRGSRGDPPRSSLLQRPSAALPNLIELDLKFSDITDEGLRAIVRRPCHRRLRVLSLGSCRGLTCAGLLAAFSHHPRSPDSGSRACERESERGGGSASGAHDVVSDRRGRRGGQVGGTGSGLPFESRVSRACIDISVADQQHRAAAGWWACQLRVLNLAGLRLSEDVLCALSVLPALAWLNVTDAVLLATSSAYSGVPLGSGSEHSEGKGQACQERAGAEASSKSPRSALYSFEYAAPIESPPALRFARDSRGDCAASDLGGSQVGGVELNVLRYCPSSPWRERGAGITACEDGWQGWKTLRTLHTDRCEHASLLIRMVADSGTSALELLTLSGPAVTGADLLVLRQACRGLASVTIRGNSVIDRETRAMLQRRGVAVA